MNMERRDLPYHNQAEEWRIAMLENHMNGDPANYEDPRFIDPLDSSLEEVWSEITDRIKELDMLTVPAMSELWNDQDLPQPIRDRALLVALGSWKVMKLLGFESMHSTMGGDRFQVGNNSAIYGEEEAQNEYKNTMMQILETQHVSGLELLSQSSYLSWLMSFYANKDIDEETFEQMLGTVDIREAQQFRADSGPNWMFYEFDELQSSRFPLLNDIFMGFYGKNKKLQTWALGKLEKWLVHRIDEDEPESSPEWLDWADDRYTFRLCSWLLDSKPQTINSASRDLMIQHFGWEVIRNQSRDPYWSDKLSLEDGLRLQIEVDDPKEKLAIIEYTVRRNALLRQAQLERGDKPVYSRRDLPEPADQEWKIEILEATLEQIDSDSDFAELLRIEIDIGKQAIAKDMTGQEEVRIRNEARNAKRKAKQKQATVEREIAKTALAEALAKARKS